jgi:hypothetical protein
MVKRIGVSVMWLLAVGWGMNYVSAALGTEPIIGLTLSLALALFIGVDPFHLFWPISTPTAVANIREQFVVQGAVRPNA